MLTHTTDPKIGEQIRQHLISKGVETPFVPRTANRDILEAHFAAIMNEMGLDLNDDSLIETPKRLAKMYTRELFTGLNYDNFPKATVVQNKMGADEMVLERNIKVSSTCEHHLLPIVGSAFVAYIPNEKVLGLSKLNRVVDFFCRRPQIQERLTLQIYHAFCYLLETSNVAVVIQAEHMCVKLRGVEDPCSDTTTSKLGGVFKRPEVRAEFIALSKGLGNKDI